MPSGSARSWMPGSAGSPQHCAVEDVGRTRGRRNLEFDRRRDKPLSRVRVAADECSADPQVPPDVPIWVDPERMSGAPCFRATRVPVDSLVTNLESGLSLAEYLDCFPDVTREQAVAVLDYARRTALQAA